MTADRDDVRRLAVDLDRFLDELPVEIGPNRASAAVRRERLQHYVDDLTGAQRLRLAGALHLLSPRLDGDLADPAQREALQAA